MTLARHEGGVVILFSFLLAALFTVLPLPDWSQAFRPQWMALVLIYWCLALPERVGVIFGWLAGILIDVLTGTLLGQHALGFSIIAYLALELHLRMRLFPLWQQALTIFVLLLVERLLSLWVMGISNQPTPDLWYWVPPLVGLFLWPWVYIVLRDVRRRFKVT